MAVLNPNPAPVNRKQSVEATPPPEPPKPTYTYTAPKEKQYARAPTEVKNLDAQRLFNHYAGSSDKMEGDALLKFYKDLDFNPDTVESTLVAYIFQVKDFMWMTHQEFDEGFSKMSVTTFDQLKNKLTAEVKRIRTEQKEMKAFYSYVFDVGCKETGYRNMTAALSAQLLSVLLGNGSIFEGNPFTQKFVAFVESTNQAINKDTFNLVPEFFSKYKTSFEGYDEDMSWPLLFDSFVEYFREQEGN